MQELGLGRAAQLAGAVELFLAGERQLLLEPVPIEGRLRPSLFLEDLLDAQLPHVCLLVYEYMRSSRMDTLARHTAAEETEDMENGPLILEEGSAE